MGYMGILLYMPKEIFYLLNGTMALGFRVQALEFRVKAVGVLGFRLFGLLGSPRFRTEGCRVLDWRFSERLLPVPAGFGVLREFCQSSWLKENKH